MKTGLLAILPLGPNVAARGASAFPPLERRSVLEAPLPAANPPVRLVRGARLGSARLRETPT